LIIRPENISADGNRELKLGTARITEAVFQGAHYRVLAVSESGQHFVLRVPPSTAPAPGDTLTLSCRAEDLVAV
jgi:ABC-type sugar transport system ATPase subunit